MWKAILSALLLLLPLSAHGGSWDRRTLSPGGTSTFSWLAGDSGDQLALDVSDCTEIAYSSITGVSSGADIRLYLVPEPSSDTSVSGVTIGNVVQTNLRLSSIISVGPYYIRPNVVASGGEVGTISIRCMTAPSWSMFNDSPLAVLPAVTSDVQYRALAAANPIVNLGALFPGYLWIGQNSEGDYLPFGATATAAATTGTCAAIPATCGSEGALYVANDVLNILTTPCTGGGTQRVLYQCDTNGAATDTWKRVWDSPHLWEQAQSGTVGTIRHTLEEPEIHRFGHAIRMELTGNNACLQSTYKGGRLKQPIHTGDSVSYIPMGGMIGRLPEGGTQDFDTTDFAVGLIQRGNGTAVILNPAAATVATALNVADIDSGVGVLMYKGDWFGWIVRTGVAQLVQFPCTGSYETTACYGTDNTQGGWFNAWNVVVRMFSPKPSQDDFAETSTAFALKVGPPGYVLEPIQGDNLGAQNPWMYAGSIPEVPDVATYTPVVVLCQHTGGAMNPFARLERFGFIHNAHDWH